MHTVLIMTHAMMYDWRLEISQFYASARKLLEDLAHGITQAPWDATNLCENGDDYVYIIYMIYMNTISLSLSLYIYIWPLKIRFRSSSINVFLDIKWNPPGTRSDIDYGNDINCQHMNSVLEVCKTWLVFRFISNKWKHCCNHFPKHLCKLQGDSGQVGPSEPPRKCWKSLSWCLKSAMNFYTTSQGPWLWGPCCLFHWIIKETQPRAFQIFKSLLS